MPDTEVLARRAERNPIVRSLARVGNAAIGLIHILIGVIAIAIAIGSGSSSSGGGGGSGSGNADQSGAMQALVAVPGGLFVLWAVVVGLIALALWQILQTVVADGAGRRFIEASKGVAYLALAVLAIGIAAGNRANASSSEKSASSTLLAQPGGVFVLASIGLVIIGVGIGFLVSGIRLTYERGLRLPPNALAPATKTLGRIGYISKGIALGVVGGLVLAGAITYDPAKASGLDGALKALTQLPFGVVLLAAIGLGLIAYGVFWCVRAVAIRL
ncbi:DUF1206 domain-containing protein [Leifsonia sp. NPDC058248]|uniref:DUF1206 domain-containing protein n=1 Tax=Leifsonia sp. NPDC058248 TaxID=3346402 RepID=UPI0036DE6D0C